MRTIAVVLGAAGYGGGELLRILSRHPGIAAVQAVSQSHAGKALHTAHPNLRRQVEASFLAAPDWPAAADGDALVVFSARRNGELATEYVELSPRLDAQGCDKVLLIDLSGDFRLKSPAAYESAYGKAHPCPAELGTFVYGLPEAKRAAISSAKRIANPGCFATAIELALLPFGNDLTGQLVAVFAATGSSGSGAHPSDTTHHPTRANDFRAYKVLAHQHEAEILEMLGEKRQAPRLSFAPHSMPVPRGIFASVHFELPEAEAARAPERLGDYYSREPFVRVLSGSPRVAAVAGSNNCEIGLVSRGTSVVVMAALDNLLKGMAGQAVQSMNIALGLDERSGLDFIGGWPY